MWCVEDLFYKFGHKMAGTLGTFISLKVLSCMPNCEVSKILMQEEQHASVREYHTLKNLLDGHFSENNKRYRQK